MFTAFVLCLALGACCAKPRIMPDGGYRAEIVAIDPPKIMSRGEKRRFEVRLRNASNVQWVTSGVDVNDLWRGNDDDRYRMRLANHWVVADDPSKTVDDARSELPNRLEPNETTRIALNITAPQTRGDYILELDVVQENVTWFADKGSAVARYSVTVE